MAGGYSEDAQPNELRAGGKGNSSVPTIRITRPRLGSRQSIKGGSALPYTSRFHASGATSESRDIARSNYVLNSSEISVLTRNSRSTEPSSTVPGNKSNNQKRPRLHMGAHIENSTVASPQGHPYPRRPQMKTNMPSNAGKEVILVDLPPSCRKGSEGGRKRRVQWVREQLNFLRIDRGLKIHEHCVVGDKLQVTCFKLASSTALQTFPSELASTKSVILPSRRASPLPRAETEGHEALSNANDGTDGSEYPGPSGSMPQSPIVTVQSPSRVSDPVSTVANLSSMLPYVCDIPVRCLEVGIPRKLSTPWILLFSLSFRNIGYYGKQRCNAAS